ncbi:MAG: hypothetical protein J0L53_14305 [Spirochaetes bacterium]|nr:hypothetical protein [Spirochaetota bacterium]MBX3722460.1 hypothetical protein [Turneriella sp.]
MKDVVFYVFLLGLYGVLALNFGLAPGAAAEPVLTWRSLGTHFAVFAAIATVARWSVMAFKRRSDRLLKGQKIVGIEEGEADHVIDVLRPAVLKREEKKPKLKRKRRF